MFVHPMSQEANMDFEQTLRDARLHLFQARLALIRVRKLSRP